MKRTYKGQSGHGLTLKEPCLALHQDECMIVSRVCVCVYREQCWHRHASMRMTAYCSQNYNITVFVDAVVIPMTVTHTARLHELAA